MMERRQGMQGTGLRVRGPGGTPVQPCLTPELKAIIFMLSQPQFPPL